MSVVAGRSLTSARKLTDEVGGQPTTSTTLSSADDELLLISVGDPELANVAELLSAEKQASIVLHTSGRNPAGILAPLQSLNSAIGSIHPLKAFPQILRDPGVAAGVVFGLDGDDPAQDLCHRLVATWSGIPVEIPSDERSLYHLAATMAAGGVMTLLASATELAKTIGLPPQMAQGLLKLAGDAIDQATSAESPVAAITGPVARGDLSGFEHQLAQLRQIDPELARLLELLAQRTLQLKQKVSPDV